MGRRAAGGCIIRSRRCATISRSLALRLTCGAVARNLCSKALSPKTGARAVYWNRLYEPWAMRRDGEIKSRLRAQGLSVESFNGALLFEPAQLRNKQGEPFKVFSPFWRACLAAGRPCGAVARAAQDCAPRRRRRAKRSTTGGCLPTKPDWAKGCARHGVWRSGRACAPRRLRARRRAGLQGRARLSWRGTACRASRRICISARSRRAGSGRRSIAAAGERACPSCANRLARVLPSSSRRQSRHAGCSRSTRASTDFPWRR